MNLALNHSLGSGQPWLSQLMPLQHGPLDGAVRHAFHEFTDHSHCGLNNSVALSNIDGVLNRGVEELPTSNRK